MAQPPRVAVVGGGIAGTLCSLVLKNRGINPTLIDGGRRSAGRLRNDGAQFLRAADPRLIPVYGMLERQGLLKEWKGRFGMLGSSGGGFLPAEIVTANTRHGGSTQGMEKQKSVAGSTTDDYQTASDAGDFCHFVGSAAVPTFVGAPSMTDLCPEILRLAGVEQVNNSSLVGATLEDGGWCLDVQDNNNGTPSQRIAPDAKFDALVLATHDPSLASGAILSIVDGEIKAGGYSSKEDAAEKGGDASIVIERLSEMADSLQKVRDHDRMPVYSVSITYPEGFSQSIPFDAVSVPGSIVVQFLVSDESKPSPENSAGEGWTAITTSQLASAILSRPEMSDEERLALVSKTVTKEIAQLFSSYHGGTVPEPLDISVKRWGAAFCSRGLQLKEDSILLAPWRLAVCGDFIRDLSAYETPLEAAALSGLEAGERTAAFWAEPEQ